MSLTCLVCGYEFRRGGGWRLSKERIMRNSGVDDLTASLRERLQEPSCRTDFANLSSPVYLPLPEEVLAQTEAKLGFHLPSVLRRVYLEVANGGFGPGYGLLSGSPDEEPSLLSTYGLFCQGEYPEHLLPSGEWSMQLLPLCDWGDAIWSCVDISSPEGALVTHDDVDGLTTMPLNMFTWLSSWVEGVDLWALMYEDREASVLNPFTGRSITTHVRGRTRGRPWVP